jgi:hypothetical protein
MKMYNNLVYWLGFVAVEATREIQESYTVKNGNATGMHDCGFLRQTWNRDDARCSVARAIAPVKWNICNESFCPKWELQRTIGRHQLWSNVTSDADQPTIFLTRSARVHSSCPQLRGRLTSRVLFNSFDRFFIHRQLEECFGRREIESSE